MPVGRLDDLQPPGESPDPVGGVPPEDRPPVPTAHFLGPFGGKDVPVNGGEDTAESSRFKPSLLFPALQDIADRVLLQARNSRDVRGARPGQTPQPPQHKLSVIG